MRVETIVPSDWASFSQAFNERHAGWLSSLQLQESSLSEGDLELTELAQGVPLLDLAFEARGGGADDRLTLRLGHQGTSPTTHIIRGVARMEAVKDEETEVALRVQSSNGETTVLSLQPPRT